MKSRSRETGSLNYRIALKLHRHIGSTVVKISDRSYKSKYKSRGFETLQDLTIRHLTEYWKRTLLVIDHVLLPMVLRREDSGSTRYYEPVRRMMPLILASPGHQLLWYWFYGISESLFSTTCPVPSIGITSQQTHYAIVTSLLRQNDVILT